MKRALTRAAIGALAIVLVAVLGIVGVAQARWDRTFDDAPVPTLVASTDSTVIERGRYLAYGPAYCAACHTANGMSSRVDAGDELPLSGGHVWDVPPGVLRSANLTPDSATGIGRYTDAQLVRAIRHGVRHDGRAMLPFMAYQNMSDDDVVAVISFLRSQAPVSNRVADHDPTLLGKAVLAFLIKPKGPEGTPPARSPVGTSVERGRYLAESVSDCAGCHTQRSSMDGSFTGPRFAGGGSFSIESKPGYSIITPNLTPDSATGRIAHWTEDQFVARFRAGRLIKESPMPWGPLRKMSDDDLRSIYRYLRTLAPVSNPTPGGFQKKKG
jgi:mono/diheme cytochrome c family protein